MESKSFSKILGSHHFSMKLTDEINSPEVQDAVLRLTQFCIRQLGASWSDSSKHGHGRDERELTALQLLVNGCWMDAVQWVAKECNAPLQGLLLEGENYYTRERFEPFRATLRTVQAEQQRAWAGMGGDVADTVTDH